MSNNWESYVRKVVPYTPGEQPQVTDVVKLNTNENPYPPSPSVRSILEDFEYGRMRLYPDPDSSVLVDAIAKRYNVKSSQVFAGVGSDDVLAVAFMTFFGSEKPVIFPNITYSFYDVWADVYRIPYKQIPLNSDFTINREDYITENGGIVIANPNAPTGVMETIENIEYIVKNNPDSVVIIDEAYVDFGGESCVPLVEKYDNLLVVQTFSKSRSMAGMRIGFAIGSKKLIGFLNDAKFSFNSYTMNATSIIAGVASVEDEAYFQKITGKVIATREWTKKELTRLGFTFTDSKTNFIFATHKSIPAQEIFDVLRENQIFVRHWNKERISNYLRISIGTDEEMKQVIEFLEKYIEERK